MNASQSYRNSIGILDNFLEEIFKELPQISPQSTWKNRIVLSLVRQASNLTHILLCNTEQSRYVHSTYTLEPIFIGTISRLLRDIYLNIAYLSLDILPVEDVKACWEFQIACQKIKTLTYTNAVDTPEFQTFEAERVLLEQHIKALTFSSAHHKALVLTGRNERALSDAEIATAKGFSPEQFQREFVFFSQFAHSSAFANGVGDDFGIPVELIAALYDKTVAYFIAIVVEALNIFNPNHPQFTELQNMYLRIVQSRWQK